MKNSLPKLEQRKQHTEAVIANQIKADTELHASCELALKKISQELAAAAQRLSQQQFNAKLKQPGHHWLKAVFLYSLGNNYFLGIIFLLSLAAIGYLYQLNYSITALVLLYLPLFFICLVKETAKLTSGFKQIVTDFSRRKLALGHIDSNAADDRIRPYSLTIFPNLNGETLHTKWPAIGERQNLTLYGSSCVLLFAPNTLDRISHLLPLDSSVPLLCLNDADLSESCFPSVSERSSMASNYCAESNLCRSIKTTLEFASEPISQLATIATELQLAQQQLQQINSSINQSSRFNTIWENAGLEPNILKQVINLINLFLNGTNPPKGILLYGPPGTGKTYLAKKIAQYAKCHFRATTLADLKGQEKGHTAPKVEAVWEASRRLGPTIMFIDECESVFARRGSDASDNFGAELVQTFSAEWDGFNRHQTRVLVIGATNRREIIDEAILSRFTTAIELPLPDKVARQQIFTTQLASHNLNLELSERILDASNGLSARDIFTLVTRLKAKFDLTAATEQEVLLELKALRSKLSSNSAAGLTWDDIVLAEATQQEFNNLLQDFLQAEQLMQLGIPTPSGILLYGPPGSGKTHLAKIFANESGMAFIAVSTADLSASKAGQASQKVKSLFERARVNTPCILFIDQLQALAPARQSGNAVANFSQEIAAQLLQELDTTNASPGKVLLLATCTAIEEIDSALLACFNRRIEIELPDYQTRLKLLQLFLKNKPVTASCLRMCESLAQASAGMSGKELQALVVQALRCAVNRVRDSKAELTSLKLNPVDLTQAFLLCKATS